MTKKDLLWALVEGLSGMALLTGIPVPARPISATAEARTATCSTGAASNRITRRRRRRSMRQERAGTTASAMAQSGSRRVDRPT